jgi:hypothetical protein
LDKVRLRFIGEYARFENIDTYHEDISAPPPLNPLSANTGFDSNAYNMIIPSKLNKSGEDEENDIDFGYNGDSTPF